jgi:hypothetical protein
MSDLIYTHLLPLYSAIEKKNPDITIMFDPQIKQILKDVGPVLLDIYRFNFNDETQGTFDENNPKHWDKSLK